MNPNKRNLESDENKENEPEAKVSVSENYPEYVTMHTSRSVSEFNFIKQLGEGSYGAVYQAQEKGTKKIVALKLVNSNFLNHTKFPYISLKEVNLCRKVKHQNIVQIPEIVFGGTIEEIFLVMEYVEKDLNSLIQMKVESRVYFSLREMKSLMYQLLSATDHMHKRLVMHRDLKPANILVTNTGVLKVADFGLAREFHPKRGDYTPNMVTRRYRAPELIFGKSNYTSTIDIWSIGCIFAELYLLKPLFRSKDDDFELIQKMFEYMGTPTEITWPEYCNTGAGKFLHFDINPTPQLKRKMSSSTITLLGFDLLLKFLTLNPKNRISAEDALLDQFFH